MSEKPSARAIAMREHRLTFEYARAHGLTRAEAAKVRAHERWVEAQARLAQTKRCGRVIPEKNGTSTNSAQAGLGERAMRPIPADAPWMMRD
jgi:hypothetical protein